MSKRIGAVFAALVVLCNSLVFASDMPGTECIHPSIMAKSHAEIVNAVNTDDFTQSQYAKVKAGADEAIKSIESSVSSVQNLVRALSNIAMTYVCEKKQDYIDAAVNVLEAALTKGYYTSYSALSTNIALYGTAVAYDWLYPDLTANQRAAFLNAIKSGLELNRTDIENNSGWVSKAHNINTISNSCILAAAAAIKQEEPVLAQFFIDKCSGNLRNGLGQFADGEAYDEGPHYWNFAVSYLAAGIMATDTALNDDFGILEVAGLEHTGYYGIHMNSPADTFDFNYADSPDDRRSYGMPQLLYFAEKYSNSDFGYFGKKLCSKAADMRFPSDMWSIMMYNPAFCGETASGALTEDRKMSGKAEVVTMRSSWGDENAAFAAAKGGRNDFEHSHLDAGDFSFSVNGVRFIKQLGWEDYSKPNMFKGVLGSGNPRYKYYLNSVQGQNCFVLNPQKSTIGQIPERNGVVEKFDSDSDMAYAVYDLTDVYADAETAKRGFMLLKDKKTLVVRDEVTMAENGSYWWFANTEANITLSHDGRSAILSKGGKRLRASLTGNGSFSVLNPEPLYYSEKRIDDMQIFDEKKLAVNFENTSNVVCEVVFAPIDDNGIYTDIDTGNTSLAKWSLQNTVGGSQECVETKNIAGYDAETLLSTSGDIDRTRDGSPDTYRILNYGDSNTYDLGEIKPLGAVCMSFRTGGMSVNLPCKFEIFTSTDGTQYKRAARCESTDVQLRGEMFCFDTVDARYIKVVSRGNYNDEDNRIRITYIAFFEDMDSAAAGVADLWNVTPDKAAVVLPKSVLKTGESVEACIGALNAYGVKTAGTPDRTWIYSDNEAVCRAEGTKITGVGAGTAQISVGAEYGGIVLWKNIRVYVTEKSGAVLKVTEDSYTRYSDINYGSEDTMNVKNSSGGNEQYIRRAYLKIDTDIENKSNIRSARLWLYGNNPSGEAQITAYAVSADQWEEKTLKYDNAPQKGSLAGTADRKLVPEKAWITIDVTELVKNSGECTALVLEQDETVTASELYTRETQFAPYVEVIYESEVEQIQSIEKNGKYELVYVPFSQSGVTLESSMPDVYMLDSGLNVKRVGRACQTGTETAFWSEANGIYVLTDDSKCYSDRNIYVADGMYFAENGVRRILPTAGSQARLTFENNEDAEASLMFVAAFYSNGVLTSAMCREELVAACGKTELCADWDAAADRMTWYIWTKNGFVPLCDCENIFME